MEVLVRDSIVQFSDLTQVVATMLVKRDGAEIYFSLTTADDMAHVGQQLLEDWFVAYNERMVVLNAETKPNLITGTIKTKLPPATYTTGADGTIHVHIGDDAPFSLACVNSKYCLDMYRIVDNRLHEFSLVQCGKQGNWARDPEAVAILDTLFTNCKIMPDGLLVTETTVGMETLPVDTKTIPLSVGHWAVMALNGAGGFSERGAVLTMREVVLRDRRKPCLGIEINHAKRYDISDEYVRAAYSSVLGYPVELEHVSTLSNTRKYLVRSNYSHTMLDEELCPEVTEPVLNALHSELQAQHLVTLLGMLPALSYMFEERQYVLIPLPVVGDMGEVAGHTMVQIEGLSNMVNGWVTELGTLVLDAADATSLGIQPIQLKHESLTYFNQIMFGLTTTADSWETLARVSAFSINCDGVAGIMADALDDRRNSINHSRRSRSRSSEREHDDRGRRDRGGRGR